MMVFIDRCKTCTRLMDVKYVEKEDLWFHIEEQKVWNKICWPCICRNKPKGSRRHKELIQYEADGGCGCK